MLDTPAIGDITPLNDTTCWHFDSWVMVVRCKCMQLCSMMPEDNIMSRTTTPTMSPLSSI